MILVIRGHLRQSFETNNLYNLIETIHSLVPDLKIFIHTWNVFANNVSWRNITINDTAVDEDIIYNYFGKLKNCISHIMIDDDKTIQLHGNLVGTINDGPMPIIGWKNYWYGKYKIIDYIYNNVQCNDETIINFRFDILNNSNSFTIDTIIPFIQHYRDVKLTKNIFLYNGEHNGVDNIYIGNIYTMYKLTSAFFYQLDDIIINNKDIGNQERLVYRINSFLFE